MTVRPRFLSERPRPTPAAERADPAGRLGKRNERPVTCSRPPCCLSCCEYRTHSSTKSEDHYELYIHSQRFWVAVPLTGLAPAACQDGNITELPRPKVWWSCARRSPPTRASRSQQRTGTTRPSRTACRTAIRAPWASTTGRPLFDAVLDPLRPEVLIYEPGTGGQMSLVRVEFIVPFSVHPKTADALLLFGEAFAQNEIFGVWALHVWTHRTAPNGLFAPWNPRVHCWRNSQRAAGISAARRRPMRQQVPNAGTATPRADRSRRRCGRHIAECRLTTNST